MKAELKISEFNTANIHLFAENDVERLVFKNASSLDIGIVYEFGKEEQPHEPSE